MRDRYSLWKDVSNRMRLYGSELKEQEWDNIQQKINDQLDLQFGEYLKILEKKSNDLINHFLKSEKEINASKDRIIELERLVAFQQKQIDWLTSLRKDNNE